MSNIKQFNTSNGEKVGLNLTQIGTYIEVNGTEKELKQYIDENAGGAGGVQNYKGLITDPNTEIIKSGDLGYYEVSEYKVKYSKYFNSSTSPIILILRKPSGSTKSFLKFETNNLYISKLNADGTYTWEIIQENLPGLPELTKVPFTYIFNDKTHSQNIEFNGEFAWSLDRQEIYYTYTIDGWTPELKLRGTTMWNEGFYDISEPEDLSKKEKNLYIKNSDGNVINTNSIKKVVKIKGEWNGRPTAEKFFNEVSAAYNEIKEGIEYGYEVVVFSNFDEYGTVQLTNIKEIDLSTFEIKGFINHNRVLTITIGFEGDIANNQWFCEFTKNSLLTYNDILYAQSVYDYDNIITIKNPFGLDAVYVSQFINKAVVNEDFYVVKTTVPKWDGSTGFDDTVYKGVYNNSLDYYISKFSGFRLNNEDTYTVDFDLLPDGQWYIIGAEYDSFSDVLNYCFVAKAVVTNNGDIDVYFGAYASNNYLSGFSVSTVTDFVENILDFYDCTAIVPSQQGNGGRRSEKNWVVVGTEKINVDAFDALATYRFIPIPGFEGKNARVRCFKRR